MLTFFIGSYTEYPIPGFGGIGHGIYTIQLNTQTGKLKVLSSEPARNPSYLALSPDQEHLYCNTELDGKDSPHVRAYKVRKDFSLEFLNEQPIAGGYPCHLVAHQNSILVACYATGNVFQYPLDASGKLLPKAKQYDHKGSSVNKVRQEAAHAHQVSVHPNGKDVYVCDLGIDRVKAYQFKDGDLVPNPAKDCKIPKGNGPRHMVFDRKGDFAYVISELTSTVSVLQRNEGVFEVIKTYPTLPKDYTGVPSASAIRIHPNEKFLYVANRKWEGLTIFWIKENSLELIGYQNTNGDELREFNITPDGQWLIACHQNSHDTVVYRIEEDGSLKEQYRTKEILSPVCVVF